MKSHRKMVAKFCALAAFWAPSCRFGEGVLLCAHSRLFPGR